MHLLHLSHSEEDPIAASFESSEFLLSAKREHDVKEPLPSSLPLFLSPSPPIFPIPETAAVGYSCFRVKLLQNIHEGPLRQTPAWIVYLDVTSRGRSRLGNVHCWERGESCLPLGESDSL